MNLALASTSVRETIPVSGDKPTIVRNNSQEHPQKVNRIEAETPSTITRKPSQRSAPLRGALVDCDTCQGGAGCCGLIKPQNRL